MEECRKEGKKWHPLCRLMPILRKAGTKQREQREFTEIEEIEIPQGIEILENILSTDAEAEDLKAF